MREFLIEARKLAYSENVPPKALIDLATSTGIRLARNLGANADIVEAGTLLMDCALGEALRQNRQKDHIDMSLQKANELMEKFLIPEQDAENIRHCILEHHGVADFYSQESEICCNADCYKFASIEGFTKATRYTREMPFDDLINILEKKSDEKWNAISLNVVKKELEPEHNLITQILSSLKNKK